MNEFEVKRLETGRDVAHNILAGLRSPIILREVYPILFQAGVAAGALHSYMLSGLVLLGEHLGYSPVCDSPVFDAIDNLLIGEGSKRPDSIWFERGEEKIKVLIEFERLKPGALESKVKNLLIMSKPHLHDLDLVILNYWSENVYPKSQLGKVLELAQNGFKTNGVQFGPLPCPLVLLETIVCNKGKGIVIEDFSVKLLVFGREDKSYISEELNTKF